MMDFKQKITEFHYGKFSLILSILLFIPSVFYYLIISFKNFLYSIRFLKEKKVPAKVICIGNLTTGGVGKTPIVIELANFYSNKGKKVAILSRGYGGIAPKNIVHVIKTYNQILIDDSNFSGDEVNLIAHKTNNAAIIVCSDRLKGAMFASKNLEAEIIIMDDGFSNRKLYKDFNIIVVDNKKMFGNGFVLPYGPLREPVSELKRAQAVIFTDKNGEKAETLDKFKSKLKIPYTTCIMKTDKVYNIKTNEILPENSNIIAFSGIGQPEQFYKKLIGFNLKKTITFPDHKTYNQEIFNKILKEAEDNDAKIVTTEKDMVKILELDKSDTVYALSLKLEVDFNSILYI